MLLQAAVLLSFALYARCAPAVCNCECGMNNRGMRVVGGNESKAHEFPWLAGLSKGGEFICGATLITRKHILTAAHCVNGFEMRELSIILADHDRKSNDRFSNIIVRGINKIREHEGFDIYSFNNDIAVIELDEPVEFNNKVQPICLPSPDYDNYDGKMAVIAGWGKTGEGELPSSILRKVAVPVWTKQECLNSGYGKKKISENMFCAGYAKGDKDACQGDSGGPLHMGNALGETEIIGVVSWGRGCARPNFPGVYTKVVNYLDWVEESLEGECLCQRAGVNPRRA